MIQVECDCGRVIKTNDENAGKKARCPECGEVVQLPAARKSATSKSATTGSRSPAKSTKRRPPEDDEFDDGAMEDDEDLGDEEEDEEEVPRSRSKKSTGKKSAKEKGDAEAGSKKTKKKKKSKDDDAELNKKIIIGTAVAAGLVVVGLAIFLIMKMPGGAAAAKVEVPKDFVAFSSPNGELSCQVPKDWASKSGGGTGGVPAYATFENGSVKIDFRSDRAGSAMSTGVQAGSQNQQNLPDEEKPVSTMHEFQKKKFKEALSDYEEQGNPEMIKTAGFGEGRLSAFTATEGFSKVFGYRITLLGVNNQWNLVCKCPGNQWKDFQPVFRKIAESAGGN